MELYFLQIRRYLIVLVLGLIFSNCLFAQDIKTIKIKTNDLIFIPSEDKIYVSVPPGEINGNSICIINPYHGEVEECFFLGGNPNNLALSNDGNTLFIGLNDLPLIVV